MFSHFVLNVIYSIDFGAIEVTPSSPTNESYPSDEQQAQLLMTDTVQQHSDISLQLSQQRYLLTYLSLVGTLH
jgi:hypothetical protein